MNYLLRPRIWSSFLASSDVGPCDVPLRYASDPTPCGCQVARPSLWSRDSSSWNIRARFNPYCPVSKKLTTSTTPDVSLTTYCDRGYARPSGRPRVSDPATYCSSTPRIQPPAVARWHGLLHGLVTAIRKTSGLGSRAWLVPRNDIWDALGNTYQCSEHNWTLLLHHKILKIYSSFFLPVILTSKEFIIWPIDNFFLKLTFR